MSSIEKAEKLIKALSEREELSREDLKALSGMEDQELDVALSILEALGLVEHEEGIIRWLGQEIRARSIVIKGKIDHVIQSPFEVRVFGLTDLKARAGS